MLIKLLLFTCLLCYPTATAAAADRSDLLNQEMDQVLESLTTIINQTGINEINIPDTDFDRPLDMHFFKLIAQAGCRNVVARAFATIHRTGNTTMYTQGNKTTVNTKLALAELGIYIDSCHLQAEDLFSFNINDIKGAVATNSIDLQISLIQQGPQCVASLDHIRLDHFGGLQVETASGPLDRIKDRIIAWLIMYFNDEVISAVNEKLTVKVVEALPRIDLCSILTH